MALATLAIPFATEPWHFYAAYVPGRAISQMTVIGIVPLTAVANWFQVMRPRALGLVTMSVPLGASVLAMAYQLLMNEYDWRAPFYVLAALLIGVVVVPSAMLLRRQPEDLGLLPDGRTAAEPSGAAGPRGSHRTAVAVEDNWTLREAMGTPTLWIIAISLGLGTLGSGGMAFNLAAFFTDANFDPTLAAGTLSVFAFTGAVGSGLWGYAAERFSIRWLSAATYAASGLSLIMLLVEPSPMLAYVFAAIFGLTARGESAIGPILVAHFYGRRSFGAINGMISPFNMAGLGLGPVVAAATFNLTGSYNWIILGFMAAFGISAVLMLVIPRPKRVPRAATLAGT
jgi:MFS family permease